MRTIHCCNIANVAYGYCKILEHFGQDVRLCCHDMTHLMSQPEWDDLELDPEDDSVFQEIRGYLLELGFQIQDFGPRSYSIEAVPAGLRHASETAMIRNMLDSFVEFRQAEFEARDAVAASFACHAAIRTGDRLTTEEMSALVDELFATSDPDHCPHGRPTVIKIPLSELDRRFKR